ncbi:hypothetical protein BASA50_011374 [Batrachochytrium salamandrivorans]|uniref:Uncharacterized protein n=1 Tax=Batrachochytrium salamandrivorans TaxID=1357716 RepID=A0ABQ8EWA4_9FUNG|nr:hypothetical protein BASA60_010924 [Batrachochytrium salamandrivorans]KAH6566492.1 hypothetical protein BASA62_006677 [Batrachochytrium salamandrivorans]KAH6587432.1 hypothetical protein BASA50_011374 [Batrachochytrium salamandrivorans]KAH6602205.1 hypothetical protein BASA61_001365 [Batrachochytrium salamandrivorans]KAJ1328437.1 hypothetical protein BSLG_010169 [Batrachochytrium salamandrivorans]
MSTSLLTQLAIAADETWPISDTEMAALHVLQWLFLCRQDEALALGHSTCQSGSAVRTEVTAATTKPNTAVGTAATAATTAPAEHYCMHSHSFPGANSPLHASTSLYSPVYSLCIASATRDTTIPTTVPTIADTAATQHHRHDQQSIPNAQCDSTTLSDICEDNHSPNLHMHLAALSLQRLAKSAPQSHRIASSGLDLLTDAMLDDTEPGPFPESISHTIASIKYNPPLRAAYQRNVLPLDLHVCAQCCHRGSLVQPTYSTMAQSRGQLLLESRRQQLSVSLTQRILSDEARLRMSVSSPERTVALDRLMRLRDRKNSLLIATRNMRSPPKSNTAPQRIPARQPSQLRPHQTKTITTVVAIPLFANKSKPNQDFTTSPLQSSYKQNTTPRTLLLPPPLKHHIPIPPLKPLDRRAFPFAPLPAPIRRYRCPGKISR